MKSRHTTLSELPDAARWLLEVTNGQKKFMFDAGMGAGKTTFISFICKALGSKDPVTSPTFALHNIYDFPGGRINHFDLYRLKSANEAFDIGIEDYLYDGDYCFIEWPNLIESLLPEGVVRVRIEIVSETERLIVV